MSDSVAAPLRMLVIDDDARMLFIFEQVFGELHDVTTAGTAMKGLDHLLAREFDLILCDLRLPDYSGMQLFEQIAVVKPMLAKDMVFMSSDADRPDFVRFVKRTGHTCLAKPFEIRQVKQLIRIASARRDFRITSAQGNGPKACSASAQSRYRSA